MFVWMMIQFQHALEAMKQKDKWGNQVPFDLEVVTADQEKKTGGDILELKNFVWVWPRSKGRKIETNHFLNGTVDLMPAGGGPITRVHLMLIRKFNAKVVC